MKQLLSLIAVFLFSTGMIYAQEASNVTMPKMTFEETTYNFGTIAEEDGNAHCTFTFTNTGDAPLIITRAAASCGCTKPTYTKAPVAPGETGEIKVTYRAAGRPGAFSKSVYIYANTEIEKNVLIIKGIVTPKPVVEESEAAAE